MRVHHLDYDTIDAYLSDFTRQRFFRAREQCGNLPVVICYIGNSGRELLQRVGSIDWDVLDSAGILRADYERSNRKTSFYGFVPADNGKDSLIPPERLSECVAGAHILVLDSLVYSGETLQAVMQALEKAGAGAVTSYGLAVRSTSMVIPNYFGFMIGHDDRALFLLREMPNNRIMPHGCLRLLGEEDLTRPPVESGVESMDRETWCDKYYSMQANRFNQTFIYECANKILAYVTLTNKHDGRLFLDAIAVDAASKGKKLGGHLLRWAETFGMHHGCKNIDMWAIDNQIEWYKRYGYSLCPERKLSLPDGDGVETYRKMTKKIIVNRFGISDIFD